MDNFVITEFIETFIVKDAKGRRKVFENRPYACFILTYKGSIKFTANHNDEIVICDENRAVFLPQGLSYVNECLEDAESYVFNFRTLKKYDNITTFKSLKREEAELIYKNVRHEKDRQIYHNLSVGAISELYVLAKTLLLKNIDQTYTNHIVKTALDYMQKNYANNLLTVSEIAKACFVSEIYLRKLFDKHVGQTPFKALTKIRMEKAKFLIEEKLPLAQVALSVGYLDIYQFSRAYKKFYGYSPSASIKNLR